MKDDADTSRATFALKCWFCDHAFHVQTVARDGIIRSRNAREGGPYRLYQCPSCSHENLCERTKKGRWFASPTSRVTILEYVFSQILESGTTSAETFLASVSWFRDNEERRRYFFEVDGDRRYGHGSWLKRLWPGFRGRPRPAGRPAGEGRPEFEESPKSREAPPPRSARRFVAPHEVLGVSPYATQEEIHAAFRRLAVQYHPDKVSHLGEEFERVALDRFLRLKDAYETLLARKG